MFVRTRLIFPPEHSDESQPWAVTESQALWQRSTGIPKRLSSAAFSRTHNYCGDPDATTSGLAPGHNREVGRGFVLAFCLGGG